MQIKQISAKMKHINKLYAKQNIHHKAQIIQHNNKHKKEKTINYLHRNIMRSN